MCHLAGKYCFKREMMGCFCQVVDSGSSCSALGGSARAIDTIESSKVYA